MGRPQSVGPEEPLSGEKLTTSGPRVRSPTWLEAGCGNVRLELIKLVGGPRTFTGLLYAREEMSSSLTVWFGETCLPLSWSIPVGKRSARKGRSTQPDAINDARLGGVACAAITVGTSSVHSDDITYKRLAYEKSCCAGHAAFTPRFQQNRKTHAGHFLWSAHTSPGCFCSSKRYSVRRDRASCVVGVVKEIIGPIYLYPGSRDRNEASELASPELELESGIENDC